MCTVYIRISYMLDSNNIQLCMNNLFLDGAKYVQTECGGTRRGVRGGWGGTGNNEKEPGMLEI